MIIRRTISGTRQQTGGDSPPVRRQDQRAAIALASLAKQGSITARRLLTLSEHFMHPDDLQALRESVLPQCDEADRRADKVLSDTAW